MATNDNGNGSDQFGEVVDFGRRMRPAAGSAIGPVLLVLAIVLGGYTSYYQVEPEEVALVTRFGKYINKTNPGLHFKLPFGIDAAIKVPVERQLKEEFGFRTASAGVRSQFATPEEASRESRMLTGDLNVGDVEWIVQYKIRDPRKFVFNVRNVNTTLRDISEASMRSVVGDRSVTEVLTIGRVAIQSEAKQELQRLCDLYETGIEVLQLVLQDVNPPEAVRGSFNEVNEAIQERERKINQAWARYNSVIPEARGRAQQTVQSAEGYATERVNESQGDVARFVALEEEYRKAPRVTRSRLYLETMGDVLPRARRRVFLDDKLEGLLPLLPLTGGSTDAVRGGAK
jgi:membrane protease subunit HflK